MKAFAYGSLGARLAHRPLTWHLHDIPAAPYLSGDARVAFRMLVRVMRPAQIVVASHAVAAISPSPRTVVVPYGVHVGRRPQPRQRSATLRIGMAARLAGWKGQHVAVQALADLRQRLGIDAELFLAGAAWFGEHAYENEVRALVRRLDLDDAVHLLGHVGDVERFYESVDVAVHASTVPEPFGISVIQALAAGRPVVGANAGGTSELLEGCDGALLTPPGDTTALAGALARFAADDAATVERRSRAAWQRARRYDARLEAVRLSRSYRLLVSEAPGRHRR